MRIPCPLEHDDSGIALLLVLGAITLMIVVATGAFFLTSQTLFETQMADQHDAAFQAANSGVMVAFADLRSRLSSRPSGGTWTGSVAASSAVYTTVATLNAAQTAYECTSTGTSRDGSSEVVVATFVVTARSASSLPWGNNVFYFAGYTGGTLVGNGTMTGPFYVAFPEGGQASLDFGSSGGGFVDGPVFVENGSLTIKSSPPSPIEVYSTGSVLLAGTAKNRPDLIIDRGWDTAKRVPITLIDAPSFLATSLQHATAQSSDNVMGDTTVPNYEANPAGAAGSYTALATNPPNDRPAGWVRVRAPGAGEAYKVVSGNLTIGPAAWGSWSGDGHYPTTIDLHDDWAYDSRDHVLYVEGTVYIDGDLTFDAGGATITYVGNGTIACTGDVSVRSSVVPATAAGSDGTPDPDPRHLLCIFAGGSLTTDANNVQLTAACYTTGVLSVDANNDSLKGSFVAERGLAGLENGARITAVPAVGTYVSPGMPVWGSGGASSPGLTMTGWRRL